MTVHGVGSGFNTSWARKEAAKNVLKIVGETAVILAAADAMVPGSVEWNPKSSDFGKIKIGNTRFDVTAGKAAIVTLAARLIKNSTKSTTTGLETQLGSGYAQRTRFDVVLDFLTNKVTPPAAVVTQWLKGETRQGDEITTIESIYSGFTPISIRNFIELKDDDSASAVAGAIVDLIGVSANTYGDSNSRNKDIISRIRNNKPLTSGQLEIYNKLTDRQKNNIDREASMTAMQAGFSHLPMDSKIYAWSKASLSEREELKDIYNESISNHIKNSIVYEDDLIEFNKRIDKAEIR